MRSPGDVGRSQSLPVRDSSRLKQRVALLLVVALFIPACGGPPRIQTTLTGEPKYLVEHWVPIPGTDKVDKRDSSLVFAETAIRLVGERESPVAWDYTDIEGASYSLSKKPSWILGASLAVFICLPCLAFAFIKKKAHWIAFSTPDGPQLFRVHKNNYLAIMMDLQRNNIDVALLTE